MSWEKTTIGSHCTVTSSKRFHLSDRSESGIPFYCSKEIIQKVNGQDVTECDYIKEESYEEVKSKFGVPECGDLLITTRGTYGVPYIYKANDKFYFADGNLTWLKEFDDNLSVDFLYYWILSYEGQKKIDAIAKGTAQKAVPIASIRDIELTIPPIETQRRIASILSAYDDLIENNQKQIKLLEEAAQRLYKEWFVDLHFPGWKTAEIVDGVPVGWETTTIDQVCDTIGGGTPSTKNEAYYNDGKIKWVTPSDITKNNGLILLDTEKKITQAGLENSSAKMLPPYSILMTSRASIGFFGICKDSVCTNQGFISCVPFREETRFYLLYNLMNRLDEIRSKATGSTFFELSTRTFRQFVIVIPSSEILQRFHTIILPIIQKQEVITNTIINLKNARDRLLPKLMSGELEV